MESIKAIKGESVDHYLIGSAKNGVVCEKPEQLAVIYGIGKTQESCIKDALHWVGKNELFDSDGNMWSELLLIKCTKEVYDTVETYGGELAEGDLVTDSQGFASFSAE